MRNAKDFYLITVKMKILACLLKMAFSKRYVSNGSTGNITVAFLFNGIN